jgi:DNA helicase-2/ATP-dependent DNA helicase PcrA
MEHRWAQLKWTHDAFEKFKKERHLIDFTDMIEQYLERGPVPLLDIIVVDEVQDLCALQHKMIDKIQVNAQKVYSAGDDDQAIYGFAGADVNHFINMKGNKRVLRQSYRCPISVQNLSQKIIDRVKYRHPKEWRGTNKNGLVEYHNYPGSVDLSREGTWFILGRTQYILDRIEAQLRLEGRIFTRNGKLPVSQKLLNAIESWNQLLEGKSIELSDVKDIYSYMSTKIGVEHGYKELKTAMQERYDIEELVMGQGLIGEVAGQPWDVAFDRIGINDKDFIRAMEIRNHSLIEKPKIQLSTIHASKGGEADNVMLLTDMSRRGRLAMHRNPDNECRVFYVGITRAKETLHIVQPQDYGGFRI